jgi:hypothetical protein
MAATGKSVKKKKMSDRSTKFHTVFPRETLLNLVASGIIQYLILGSLSIPFFRYCLPETVGFWGCRQLRTQWSKGKSFEIADKKGLQAWQIGMARHLHQIYSITSLYLCIRHFLKNRHRAAWKRV